ncbi:MAG TPA: pitrilysin family protein [Polyangiaceae bacterium]
MSAGTTQRFDVGGTVVFLEENHALPLVAMSVLTRSGAAHDPQGKTGLARVTSRMLLRGCEGATAQQIEELLDGYGAEAAEETTAAACGISMQGITRNLDKLVDLGARIVGAPTFAPADFARLIREMDADQLEMRDEDRTLAERAVRRAIFGDHTYGRLTTRDSLAAMTVDDVRGFHAKHYVRNNVVVSIAGDVTPDQAKSIAEKMLSRLPPGERQTDPTTDPTEKTGRRLLFVDKPERTQTQIYIGGLGTSPHDDDHFPLIVGDAVLGGSFTSRLMREVRSKRGWSYGASSHLDVARKRHRFSAHTFPAATDAAACLALELDLIDKYVDKGITPRELAFIKKFLVRGYAFEVDTAPKRVQQAVDIELYDWPADYHTGYVDKVKNADLDTVNGAIKRRIKPENLAVVMVGTASQILEAVQKAIPNLASTDVIPFDKI